MILSRSATLGILGWVLFATVSASSQVQGGGVTLSGGVSISGGVTLSGSGSPSSATWSDTARRVTLAVGVKTKDEFGVELFQTGGVAVLIADKDNHPFIATALHVFSNPKENWLPESLQIRGWKDEQTSRYVDFGSPIVLKKDGKQLYTASDAFDLAIIPATKEIIERLKGGDNLVFAIHPGDLGDRAATYDGEDVFILGFPALVGEQYQQRALMRSGIIAWTDPSGPAEHEFLIDARIFRGNSGGPVFSSPAGTNRDAGISTSKPVKLLGLVSQTINAKPDVAFGVNLPDKAMVIGAAGVGVIEPSQELLRLMAKAEQTGTQ